MSTQSFKYFPKSPKSMLNQYSYHPKQSVPSGNKYSLSQLNQKLSKQTQMFNKKRQQIQRSRSKEINRMANPRSKSHQRKQLIPLSDEVKQYLKTQQKQCRQQRIKKYKLTSLASPKTIQKLQINTLKTNKKVISHKPKNHFQYTQKIDLQSQAYLHALKQMQSMVFISGQEEQSESEDSINSLNFSEIINKRNSIDNIVNPQIHIPYFKQVSNQGMESFGFKSINQGNPQETLYFSFESIADYM